MGSHFFGWYYSGTKRQGRGNNQRVAFLVPQKENQNDLAPHHFVSAARQVRQQDFWVAMVVSNGKSIISLQTRKT